jgi:hypothetical protein
MTILINLSHPLTDDQLAQINAITHQEIDRVMAYDVYFDNEQPFVPQLYELMEHIPLTSEEWQTRSILVNPPSLNIIAILLLAELHGRMGYFPPVIRLRPAPDVLPTRYEVAEILNLQSIRDKARQTRSNGQGRRSD